MFALVDCNSFYCSCEQVFNPKLKGKPVIVLSNNDGVTISRTDEAKSVGIKMGAPLHLIQHLVKANNVHVFSSNYTLYGDLSARIMDILSQLAPELEIYSIDEAFLNFDGLKDFHAHGLKIHSTIKQWTGIPTCVGIGPTKVLAKIANNMAKKQKNISPVFDLSQKEVQDQILTNFPVNDVWGIGAKSAIKLNALGIFTAKELRDADLDLIQKSLTIVGRKIACEIRGISCLPLELITNDKKQIISSRSFGRPVFKKEELEEAIANYVSRAAEKLRAQDSICGQLRLFIHTNRFKETKQYYNHGSIKMLPPTASTSSLVKAACLALENIFKPGIEYKKAGIILSDIEKADKIQFSLFDAQENYFKEEKTMKIIDQINSTFGSGTIKIASCGTSTPWQMNSQFRSPCYTTRWDDLLKVK